MKLPNSIRKFLGLKLRYYKVVLRNDGQLLSIVNSPGSVRYYPKQWAIPLDRNGPLCVFETLKQAILLMTEIRCWTGSFEIWTCEIAGPTTYRHIWYFDSGIAYRENLRGLPAGTKLAGQVKLLEKVSSWSCLVSDYVLSQIAI